MANDNYVVMFVLKVLVKCTLMTIKRVGPNKQVGWLFYVNFVNKQALPNKQVGCEKKLKIQKIVPNK